jgi:hypothetical protein
MDTKMKTSIKLMQHTLSGLVGMWAGGCLMEITHGVADGTLHSVNWTGLSLWPYWMFFVFFGN